MAHALLLDLDDTLLHNSMDDFLPPYFSALSAAVAEHVERERFLRALQRATGEMMVSTDLELSNEAVFWRAFEPLMPVDRTVLEPIFIRFYDETFPTLFGTTAPMAGSSELIAAARDAGWRVAVATNPLFPLVAIRHRLTWAGLDERQFDLITSYENMHCTKPHPDYFLQIARLLEMAPEACVMAGNHLSNDLVGAAAVGMRTFWVTDYGIADAEIEPDRQGSLDDLRRWLFGDGE